MRQEQMRKGIHLHVFYFTKAAFWFLIGICLGLFFTISFSYILFQRLYGNTIYPGVYVNNVNFGGKTEAEVTKYFDEQNKAIEASTFTFTYADQLATASAKDLGIGYDSKLLAHQALSIGRSKYILSDIVLVFSAYLNGVFLSPAYTFTDASLTKALEPIRQVATIDPVDALFTFQNGRVTTFRPSSDGQEINMKQVRQLLLSRVPGLILNAKKQEITFAVPITTLHPKVTTNNANNLGIKELIATGTSLFQHSIPGRIYNVTLAATRLNGVLIPPGDVFSFDKALGDVSAFTGYQQAYVIQGGKTVLGDGGGVCQVSTTMFRAALAAGLPIVERHGHDYRVGYYEEDSPPGIDATVYVPSVDLKFKNDTGHYILIQTIIDPSELRLTFNFYGTSDGRSVSMTTPTVTNITPPLPTVYTDDPTLPAGELKQVDFAAGGATTSFSRTVTRDGKTILQDTYTTVYRPWAAAYLRGTKIN